MKRKYLSVLFALTATIFAITGCGSDSEPSATNKTEKPSVEISESIDSTESDVSENVSETETETITEEPTTEEFVLDTSYDTLNRITNLPATCETDINACYVDVTSENPYDIVWDYGEEYEKYIATCDWSLVWDYDFYVKTFPMLAELYHYDEELLLRHFQTVGIHEGRMGREDLCISLVPIKEGNWAYRYLKFMFDYDEYAADMENGLYRIPADSNYIPLQQTNIMTALEKEKLSTINMLVEEYNAFIGSKNRYELTAHPNDLMVNYLTSYDEAACFANLRAYLGAHDGYTGDDWFKTNYLEYIVKAHPYQKVREDVSVGMSYLDYDGKLTIDDIMANIDESSNEYVNHITNPETDYKDIGISNIYYNPDTNKSCHVDTYSELESRIEWLYRLHY